MSSYHYPWLERFGGVCQIFSMLIGLVALVDVAYVLYMMDPRKMFTAAEVQNLSTAVPGGLFGFFGLWALNDWIGLQIDLIQLLRGHDQTTPGEPRIGPKAIDR